MPSNIKFWQVFVFDGGSGVVLKSEKSVTQSKGNIIVNEGIIEELLKGSSTGGLPLTRNKVVLQSSF